MWAVSILLVIVVFSETAFDKQTSRYEQELLEARKLVGVKQLEALKELATKVGAVSEHTEIVPAAITENYLSALSSGVGRHVMFTVLGR